MIEPLPPSYFTQEEYLEFLREEHPPELVDEAMRECGGNAAAATNWIRVMLNCGK